MRSPIGFLKWNSGRRRRAKQSKYDCPKGIQPLVFVIGARRQRFGFTDPDEIIGFGGVVGMDKQSDTASRKHQTRIDIGNAKVKSVGVNTIAAKHGLDDDSFTDAVCRCDLNKMISH